MLNVTERARGMFRQALDQISSGPDVALRLGPTDSGFGVFPDTRKDDDQVIEHDGQAVLLLDREISEALADKTVDVEDHAEGARFVRRA